MFIQNKDNDDESQIQQGQQVSQNQESSQFVKVKYAGRKNFCEVCHHVLSKYTCPKCTVKTCSLICTHQHKTAKNCNGIRQPTQYLPKEQIDPRTVQKDYNFIENMISNTDKVKKVLTGVNQAIKQQPTRFKILRNNAKQLYNIKVSNAPNMLQRHTENLSFFYRQDKCIYWVFELLYFLGKKDKHKKIYTAKVLSEFVSDQKIFVQVLPQDYLNQILLEQKSINTTKREQFCIFLQNKQQISKYSAQQRLKRRENAVVNQKAIKGEFSIFYELIEYYVSKKVCEQMRDISIVEFPTLYIVHNSMREEFIQNYKASKLIYGIKQEQQKERESKDQRQRSREKTTLRKKLRSPGQINE